MLQEPRLAPSRAPHLRVVPRKAVPIETTGETISTRLVETLPELVSLEQEWEALFNKSSAASPPLRWGWVREWWRYFGTPERKLTILTVRRGGDLIGVLPLYREMRGAGRSDFFTVSLSREPSHSFYPEYIDVLHASGTDAIVTDAICRFAATGGFGGIRTIHFGLCRKDGLLERVITPALKYPWGDIVKMNRSAPIADLRGGFDGYLARLSANSRQQMRRLIRAFKEQPDFHFEVVTTHEAADRCLLELIELHQAKWHAEGEPGAFSTPERIAFHRAVVARLFDHVVLSRLMYRGKTVTALYGFVVGKKFDFYQSGNSIVELPLKRPGILAHLLTMEALIGRGIETYDFLEGEAPYKMQLRTTTLALTDVRIHGPSPINIFRRGRRDLSAILNGFLR